jgi:hypothetical protein
LRSVEQHRDARMGATDHLFDRNNRAQHVRHVRERHQRVRGVSRRSNSSSRKLPVIVDGRI